MRLRRRVGLEPRPRDDGRPRALVTGAGGTIGRVLIEGLAAEYDLYGLDMQQGPGVDRVADMTDLRRASPAFEGMDAVVDLAADPRVSASWSSVLDNNVRATVNALEAARLAGVRRVVFASSNHVVGMYEQDEPYASIVRGTYEGLAPELVPRLTASAPIRPDGPYGVGKALGEAAARFYADAHGISVVCLRIGTVSVENRPTEPRHFATFLTHRDLVSLVRSCLHAPDSLGFGIFYGVSANTWRFWDLDEARSRLGFWPQDDAEAWR